MASFQAKVGRKRPGKKEKTFKKFQKKIGKAEKEIK